MGQLNFLAELGKKTWVSSDLLKSTTNLEEIETFIFDVAYFCHKKQDCFSNVLSFDRWRDDGCCVSAGVYVPAGDPNKHHVYSIDLDAFWTTMTQSLEEWLCEFTSVTEVVFGIDGVGGKLVKSVRRDAVPEGAIPGHVVETDRLITSGIKEFYTNCTKLFEIDEFTEVVVQAFGSRRWTRFEVWDLNRNVVMGMNREDI